MDKLFRYFLRGVMFSAPIGLTAYACWWACSRLGGLLNNIAEQLFGAGHPVLNALLVLAIMLLAVLLIGVLVSNFITWRFMSLFEKFIERLPMVKLLYTSLRDLLSAFVGEKKRFDKPVRVRPFPGSEVSLLGFVTRGDLSALKLPGCVAVYVPQSYNFAGTLLVVPRESVTPLEVESSAVMAFVVSGGASLPLPGADGAPATDSRRIEAGRA